MRYKENLKIEGDKVYSYGTHVATMEGGRLLVHGYWSQTTSKHINYVASEYGLTKVEAQKEDVKESGMDWLNTVASVASLADIFTDNKTENNDWKIKMLKAGLDNRGLIMPDDWDSLGEEDKETRLNGAIKAIS